MNYIEGLRNILNEVEVGGQEPAQPQQPAPEDEEPVADDEDGGEDFMDNDEGGEEPAPEEGGEPAPEEGGEEPATDDEDGGEDFMDNDEGGEEPAPEEGEEDGGEDFMDNESEEGGEEPAEDGEEGESEEGDDEDSEYDIEKIEDELFSDLTPEQIAIKNHELKNNFVELYSIIGSTLVRINDISKSNDNVNILKFITEKLLELREMIDFNITTAYQTRTYIENNIIYQQCIATLNTIAEIIDQLPKLDNKQIDSEKKEKEEDKGYPVEQDEESQDSLDISDSSVTLSQEGYDYSSEYNDLF